MESIVLGYSLLIAGLIALIRFRQIRPKYYPFIYLIWIGCLNEMLNHWLVANGHYNIINTNIYSLVEAMLLLMLFRNMGAMHRMPVLYWVLMAAFTLSWVVNNFILHPFGSTFSSYFFIIYSFPIVLLGINTINRVIVREREILRSPEFLISIGIVVYFTYGIIVELFWIYGLNASKGFRINVYAIMYWINLVTNLIYALAVLWMQKRQAFTLPY